MKVRQLQIFVAVAEACSFSRAAERLYIAQSAVSTAIKNLELELDVTLLNRQEKQVSLTVEGQVLLQRSQQILLSVEQTRQEIRDMRELHSGDVYIGMPTMLASYYFPEAFVQFKQRYPQLRIQLIEQGTRQSLQRLINGQLNMGIIMAGDAPDELQVTPIIREEMVAAVAVDHPLANSSALRFEQLIEQPLILPREGYFLRETIERLCQQQHYRANILFETNLVRLMCKLVASRVGVSVSLKQVTDTEQSLIGIPFTPPVFFDMALAWNKNRYLSQANRAFAEFLINKVAGKNTLFH